MPAKQVEPNEPIHGAAVSRSTAAASCPPMRVLHVMPEYWLERTQSWLYTQITSLPPQVENHVVCHRTRLLAEFPFPRLHCRADASGWRRLLHAVGDRLGLDRHSGYRRHVAKRVQPDVVHSHFGPTGWGMAKIARAHGAAHVVTFYGLDVNYLPRAGWSARYLEMFPNIDRVLCEGPHMRRCVIDLGCPAERVHVHRLGVDLTQLPFQPRQWRPGQPLRVLLAASFREKKGLSWAIRALGRLRAELPLEIAVIGGPDDSPEGRRKAAVIAKAVAESGLGDRIRLHGFRTHEELLAIANQCQLFLSPSVTAQNGDTEGGAPVTLIEMIAAGMPVVSSRHCDIPDIVEHGVTGFLAEERDLEGIVAAVRSMLAAHERWPAMLAEGRARIEARHDARQQALALAEHYAELRTPSASDRAVSR